MSKSTSLDRHLVLGFSTEEKEAAFAKVKAQLEDFFAKYPGLDVYGRMATINSFLACAFPYWHFVGFYCVRQAPTDILHIGPYQGKVLATGEDRSTLRG